MKKIIALLALITTLNVGYNIYLNQKINEMETSYSNLLEINLNLAKSVDDLAETNVEIADFMGNQLEINAILIDMLS